MTQYAYYDSTVPSPSPILGWFDTDVLHYPNLPVQDKLFEMSADQWDARLTGRWAISNNQLVSYTPAYDPTLTEQAIIALGKGLTVTSGGPSLPLNAVVFPTDPTTTTKIGLVVTTLSATNAFPGGSETFPMKDATGEWWTLNPTQYMTLASALSTYVAALNLIADGNPLSAVALPSNQVNISL